MAQKRRERARVSLLGHHVVDVPLGHTACRDRESRSSVVGQPHVHVATGPAQRDRLELFLAVVSHTMPATTGTGWLNVCLGTRAPVEFTLACSAARCACDHVADRPQLAQQLRGA